MADSMAELLTSAQNPKFKRLVALREKSRLRRDEGVFVVEVLRRKFSRCKKRADFTTALRSVYAMELLPDNVEKTIKNVQNLCVEHFKPTKAEMQIINDHIIQADALKVMRMIAEMNERCE